MTQITQQIPAGWTSKTLSELCDILIGGTPSRNKKEYWDSNKDGNNVWISIRDLSNGPKYIADSAEYISDTGIEKSNVKPIPKGTVLMSFKLTIGRTAITAREVYTNEAIAGFLLKNKDFLDPKFLYYALPTLQYDVDTAVKGATLNKEKLKTTNIILPTLHEQTKIATILSKVDDEIEKVEKVIERTEKLKKGLMQNLLTKGIGHTKFKQTELGEIPEEWETKKLGKVCKFENGKAHEKQISENGNYIVVNSKFISTDGETVKHTNDNLKPLSVGDIVMVMSDVPSGKALGKCFLISKNNSYTLNQRICSLRPINGNSNFYFHVLNRNNYFLSFDNGVGQTNLRKDEVLDCPVPVPPITEQEQIAKILNSIEDYTFKNIKIRFNLLKLKKGLMNDLLSGKVRTI